MPQGSYDYGRRRGSYSHQDYAARGSDIHSRFHNLQKTFSDNRYDRRVRYDRVPNEYYNDWNGYKREKRRLAQRFRGGADSNMDCCQQLLNQIIRKDNQDGDSDLCNPDRYRRKLRERDPRGHDNGVDSDLEHDRCRHKKSQPNRCDDSDDYRDPCGDRCIHSHNKKHHRRDKSSRRRSDRYNDYGCNDICGQLRDDPCVKIHKVSHACSEMVSLPCNPKSCLAFKSKNQAGGDVAVSCCSCDTCPFCLLRQFCTEVLQELAEIKAKQIGGELEGLIYVPDSERGRASEMTFDEKKGYSKDSMGLWKRTKSSEFGISTDSLGRKHRRRSNDDYSHDDSRGRWGRDDYSRGRRGRGSYDSFDRAQGRDRDKGRRGGHDGDKGKYKKGKDNKKEKEKEEKPVDLPEDVKKELEKAQRKAEKAKKKKETEQVKKALIEMRLIESSQLAGKGCKAFSAKPYSGPGRFAEVNICDFMKMRLESLIERESALKRSFRSMCCPSPCHPPCMPPTYCINPKYCCTSFWCPQPTVPSICC